MRPTRAFAAVAVASLLGLPAATVPAAASGLDTHAQWFNFGWRGAATVSAPPLRGWMSPEIGDAWGAGFQGQGTRIAVIDDFRSASRGSGDLGPGQRHLRHGEWVRDQAAMIAPRALVTTQDFNSGGAVRLTGGQLNVLNLSYGMMARAGLRANQIRWAAQERSTIGHARTGRAVVVKAAGNDAVAVTTANGAGHVDYLNTALAGTSSAIFVGALDRNGTVSNPAVIASYSNRAGKDPQVQAQFLMVGVRGDLTGLHGTSFAAPVISGYAAVLGSKFTRATPTQIVEQLLSTARTDTIHGYAAHVHGRGEASIARALAPVAIR